MNNQLWKFGEVALKQVRVQDGPPIRCPTRLTNSIDRFGICTPVMGIPRHDNPNNIQLISGKRRFQSAKTVGMESLPVYFNNQLRFGRPEDMGAIREIQITTQKQEEVHPLELGRWCREMVDGHNVSISEAARRLHMSRPKLQDLLKVHQFNLNMRQLHQEKGLSAEIVETLGNLQMRKLVLLARSGITNLDKNLLAIAKFGTTRELEAALGNQKEATKSADKILGRIVKGIAKAARQAVGQLDNASSMDALRFESQLALTLREAVGGLSTSRERVNQLLKRLGEELVKGLPEANQPDSETTAAHAADPIESKEISNNNTYIDSFFPNSISDTEATTQDETAIDKTVRDRFLRYPSQPLNALEVRACDAMNRGLSYFDNNLTPHSLGRFLRSGLDLETILGEYNSLIHRPGNAPGAVLYNQLLRKVIGTWRPASKGFVNRKYFKKGAPGDEEVLLLKPLFINELKRELKRGELKPQNGIVDFWDRLKEKMAPLLSEPDQTLLEEIVPVTQTAETLYLQGAHPAVGDLLLETYGDALEAVVGKTLEFI